MTQELFEIMRRASLFVIFAQAVVHFCPKESYEKYLKLFVSLMTITVLIFPLFRLLKADVPAQFEEELNKYDTQIKQLMQQMPKYEILDEKAYLSTISNEIKNKINNLSGETGYIAKTVEIQGSSDKGYFMSGEEKVLKIVVERENKTISTMPVDKIKCSVTEDKNTRHVVENGSEPEIASKLCITYAAALGMDAEDVEVIIYGMEK